MRAFVMIVSVLLSGAIALGVCFLFAKDFMSWYMIMTRWLFGCISVLKKWTLPKLLTTIFFFVLLATLIAGEW